MDISLSARAVSGASATNMYDVAVVGAGPYGLSIAAHLLKKGVNVAVFGKPLQLWQENMPKGMCLRSYWWATSLSDPDKEYSFARYFQTHRLKPSHPLPIETFLDYGRWFQQNAVPLVDETYVSSINQTANRFVLSLQDEREVTARVIVLAMGLVYYTYRPEQYEVLSSDMVSHAFDHTTFDQFKGKHVVVIGGGQSALEMSALLHESDVEVEVISRSPVRWLEEEDVEQRSLYERLRYPRARLAPGWFNWGLEHFPYGFQRLPRATKDRLMKGRGRFGPAGAGWLRPRVIGKVALHEGYIVQNVQPDGQKVKLELSAGKTIYTDHVMLATGYRVDVRALPMLGNDIQAKIKTYRHAPILNAGFESSVPGLYFVGLSAVSSFGPFYRFVAGTEAAACRVAQHSMKYMAPLARNV